MGASELTATAARPQFTISLLCSESRAGGGVLVSVDAEGEGGCRRVGGLGLGGVVQGIHSLLLTTVNNVYAWMYSCTAA